MVKEVGKTKILFSVNTRVKEKFESACGFRGMDKHTAIEEAMGLFTDKYIKEVKQK